MLKRTLTLAGKMTDPYYEKCRAALHWVASQDPSIECIDKPMFETEWNEFLKEMKAIYGGPFKKHKISPLVFVNAGDYIGGAENFMIWLKNVYNYTDKTSLVYYKRRCKKNMTRQTISNPTRAYCYMDFALESQGKSTVVFELFLDVAPRTSKNFMELCQGFKNEKGNYISYSGSTVHRIVPGGFLQAGDIIKDGSKSIYQGEFPDETFAINHNKVGLLGMAKRDGQPHTNECQFYVTLGAPLTFMDKVYVVFGRVVQGMRRIRIMEKCADQFKPHEPKCTITACGIYEYGKPRVVKISEQ